MPAAPPAKASGGFQGFTSKTAALAGWQTERNRGTAQIKPAPSASRLPAFVLELIANVPEAGAGVHAFLFKVARQLWAHMDGPAIEAVLTAATVNVARRVTAREIRDAVYNARPVAWKRSGQGERARTRFMGGAAPLIESEADAWPESDPMARFCRIKESEMAGVGGVYDLWGRSPARPDWSVDDWIDWLFPGAEWLCLAEDHPATARTRPPAKWYFGPAEKCGLIVPSPMTGPSGLTKDGKRSHRCLENTGPRRWLVIEFDKLEDGRTPMPMDEQAALHWHFYTAAPAVGWPPVRLCVHSGGKSLHAWCGPVASEEAALELMAYAVSLGADPSSWNRCQLMRLPGGVRAAKDRREINLPEGWGEAPEMVLQSVMFFAP